MTQEDFSFEWKHFNSMDFGSYGLGASVTPMGSQLMNTNTAINWGVNNLELSMADQMRFDQAGHIAQIGGLEREEVVRLAKLNRINLSVHAPPTIDIAGFGQGEFSEEARQTAIREIKNSINFADQIGVKSGVNHVPIVIHAAYQPIGSPMPQEKIYYVDRDSGKVGAAQAKQVTYKEGHLWSFGLISKEEVFDKKYDENIIARAKPEERAELERKLRQKKEDPDYKARIQEAKQRGLWDYEHVGPKEEPSATQFWLTPTGILRMSNKSELQQIDQGLAMARYHLNFEKGQLADAMNTNDSQRIKDVATDIQSYEKQKDILEAQKLYYKEQFKNEPLQAAGEFAKDRIAKSIAELAKYSFEKESKPMIVVENWVPESVAGNPEKVAEIIRISREKFATELMTQQRYSQNEAMRQAEQIIGVNFDIGHANLWKKYQKWDEAEGKMVDYTNEDIKKWASQTLPYIKHVHLTDNFGDMDAHLPVGWGNAPIREVIENLKQQGWSGRAILETFGAVQYGGGMFGVAESLYQTGMPLIPGGPSWEKAAGSYFQSGYGFTGQPQPGGTYWPDVGQYAVGFSGLPYSTGSRMGGPGKEGAQFSGAPMS